MIFSKLMETAFRLLYAPADEVKLPLAHEGPLSVGI